MQRAKPAALIAITAYTIMKEMLAKVKAAPFSLSLDKSTTIAVEKVMVVMVRNINHIPGQVDSLFLSLSEVPDASVSGLFSSLEAIVHEKKLSFTTLVGFATDGTSVMQGRHNSVTQWVRVKQPNLLDLHCPCHAAALIASSASKAISDYVEQLCRGGIARV